MSLYRGAAQLYSDSFVSVAPFNRNQKRGRQGRTTTRNKSSQVRTSIFVPSVLYRILSLYSCAEGLRNIVSVAPFDLNQKQGGAGEDDDQDQATDRGPSLRVLACCWGPGKPATTFAMLDANGELVDFLHTGFITARASGDNQQMLRAKRRTMSSACGR